MISTLKRSALAVAIAASLCALTPDDAHAYGIPGGEATAKVLLGAAAISGGLSIDVALIRGREVSTGLALTFSIGQLALGAGLIGYGIRHKQMEWVFLGAFPLVIGLVGALLTPVRALQRRAREEEPGEIAMPLNTGFGWSFQVGS